MLAGVVVGREKDTFAYASTGVTPAEPEIYLMGAVTVADNNDHHHHHQKKDEKRVDSVITSKDGTDSDHAFVQQKNGDCRTKRVGFATQKECYSTATRRWTVTETIPDCRDKRVGFTTVRECYNINTRRWDVTQTIPDCRDRRQGFSTIRECYNTNTRRWDITQTIPDCREIKRANAKVTECWQNNRWMITKTEFDCRLLRLGGKLYKECWNGRTWAGRVQLQCEKYLGRDRCWDPVEQEWEWENINENDGTLDGSLLTSIETDGQIATSASNGNIVVENKGTSVQTSTATDDVHTSINTDKVTPDNVDASVHETETSVDHTSESSVANVERRDRRDGRDRDHRRRQCQ